MGLRFGIASWLRSIRASTAHVCVYLHYMHPRTSSQNVFLMHAGVQTDVFHEEAREPHMEANVDVVQLETHQVLEPGASD